MSTNYIETDEEFNESEEAQKYCCDFFELIASSIESFCNIPGCEELIEAIKNKQSFESIQNLPFVKQCLSHINDKSVDLSGVNIINKLGNGAYGCVFLGEKNGMKFAIKESDSKHTGELRREAIVMGLCDHPNIVNFYGFNVENVSLVQQYKIETLMSSELPHSYLIMECCDGGNLENLVDDYSKKGRLIPPELVECLFIQMVEPQLYLHFEKNIIHRDVKLENYLITNDGKFKPNPTVKLSDFGFARAIDGNLDTKSGTPLYIPIEVFNKTNTNSGSISDKRDIYGIGICLYKIITTKYPFGISAEQFLEAMREQKPIELPEKFNTKEYEQLNRLVVWMTKHKAEERMSWEQLRDDQYIKYLEQKYGYNN